MTTIDKIDFTKMKPYDGKVTKCFEQFYYQIAKNEYGHLGDFTTIDGSGGDGGVEFYLTLNSGERWGWQCKYFSDTGRLNVSSRYRQIEHSVETACRNHTNLTKLFICLKTNLTGNNLSVTGKNSKGEQSWFKTELINKIPKDMKVDLIYWGESEFLAFLRKPQSIGIRNFFFGKLELTQDWFHEKFNESFERIKHKYDPELHTIDKYTQTKIDFLLLDKHYCEYVDDLLRELEEARFQFDNELSQFENKILMHPQEYQNRKAISQQFKVFYDHFFFVNKKIEIIKKCFELNDGKQLEKFDINELTKNSDQYYDILNYSKFVVSPIEQKDIDNISHSLNAYRTIYEQFFRNYFHKKSHELHLIADAAKGKTHLSGDIAYKKITNKQSVIFITGDKFSNEANIEEALKKILDISQEYTTDDFLASLDLYASINKSKIPIIIDGLNETTCSRTFSEIWKNHLDSFITKVSKYEQLVVITTCRHSYIYRIWSPTNRTTFHYLYGFNDYETIEKAVKKYFSKYNLKTDFLIVSLEKFKEPIFLKIYCEIKNPNCKSTNEIEVNFDEESTWDVFKEYLNQVNKRIVSNNPLFKSNENFIFDSLRIFSNVLWKNDSREILIKDFYRLIDGDVHYEKDKSKAEILMNEGLLVFRDANNKTEHVKFTYDTMAGYIISDRLINCNCSDYFISRKFIKKLFYHPLHEDICHSICMLFPKKNNISIHNLIIKKNTIYKKILKQLLKFFNIKMSEYEELKYYLFNFSINSLFVLPAIYVNESDKTIIKKLVNNSIKNKTKFFSLSETLWGNVSHPFNSIFLSKILKVMPINQRDVSWTEYVRKNAYNFMILTENFEKQCKNVQSESEIIIKKQHLLSRVIMWFLTSTNRKLRDCATRALYYYGRKFPKDFIALVYDSLKINDPYVWERTLAALYGVVMAEHNSLNTDNFKDEILPELAKNIYDFIFKQNAQYSTTHILARDYARRIIEIDLMYHYGIFTQEEIKNIRPPYLFGGIRNLEEYDYEKSPQTYGLMQMDFSNYTIGNIVRDGYSYDDPQAKKEVRRQIYWRIYNLGWNEKLFKDIDNEISKSNYSRENDNITKIDRYGKKYAWIAYFENAGLRDDKGLLPENFDGFRIADADIDPSFPEESKNEVFFKDSMLGEPDKKLIEWYEKENIVLTIDKYLSMKNLCENNGEWVCLDGFIRQENNVDE
ncbi:MAG: hypothetical protein LBM99_00570, partial [Bacillales bacterium]|nr:hypothetical protein [Bacillales bacterium]